MVLIYTLLEPVTPTINSTTKYALGVLIEHFYNFEFAEYDSREDARNHKYALRGNNGILLCEMRGQNFFVIPTLQQHGYEFSNEHFRLGIHIDLGKILIKKKILLSICHKTKKLEKFNKGKN